MRDACAKRTSAIVRAPVRRRGGELFPHAVVRRSVRPDLVEPIERGADHRRRRRRSQLDLRRDGPQLLEDQVEHAAVHAPDQTAGERDLDAVVLQLEPGQRGAREIDDLRRDALDDARRDRVALRLGNTIGGNSRTRRRPILPVWIASVSSCGVLSPK